MLERNYPITAPHRSTNWTLTTEICCIADHTILAVTSNALRNCHLAATCFWNACLRIFHKDIKRKKIRWYGYLETKIGI
jgi:hypothetical protein